ncbi:hypothetical protein QJS10_CPB04g01814 [Acorus calamus]|uniref:Transmembrane 9 superfamily member n=1 Tax=Acorus calamus TaxID=4465 RepID=A0AAV9F0Y2_ACOCL|nr:hypothetical protein QJS10_CPB04g01814 [Acorus calamus]
MLTGCLFCGPLFLTFCFLNSATAALIWMLVTSSLLVLGGIAGKNSKAEFQAPCRTTKYPREIPPLPWSRGIIPQMAMAGFLLFSAVYIELYYIFTCMWGRRIYTIYNILFIVFIILLIVTTFVMVALHASSLLLKTMNGGGGKQDNLYFVYLELRRNSTT